MKKGDYHLWIRDLRMVFIWRGGVDLCRRLKKKRCLSG